jgi:hypothetical protein
VSAWTRTYIRIRIELGRLTGAVRGHWKRILVGGIVGCICAIFGAAIALAWLEVHGVVSKATADELGPVIVFYGMCIGALNAYVFRPARGRR